MPLDTGVAPEASWPARARKTRVLGAIILLVGGAYSLAFAAFYGAVDHKYPDFFGFWSFARFAGAEGFPALYDNRAVEAYEYATGLVPPGYYPYLYPPPFLLLLMPLAPLPYLVARLAWIVGTGGAFLAAVCAPGWRRILVIAALACPTTTLAAAFGQNGFLIGALMLGGLRCLGRADFCAGFLLGAVTLKPQFAILLPVAILAYGRLRVILGAAISAAGLAIASAATFGPEMWAAWLARMQQQFGAMASGWSEQITKAPTVTASVLTAGGDTSLAHIAQGLAALIAGIVLWRSWRSGREGLGMPARALLPVGTFLAAPYTYTYDLPMISGAILLVVAERFHEERDFGFAELVVFAAALLAPVLLSPALPSGPILICAILALLFWHLARRAAGDAAERIMPSPRSRTPAPAPSGAP